MLIARGVYSGHTATTCQIEVLSVLIQLGVYSGHKGTTCQIDQPICVDSTRGV